MSPKCLIGSPRRARQATEAASWYGYVRLIYYSSKASTVVRRRLFLAGDVICWTSERGIRLNKGSCLWH